MANYPNYSTTNLRLSDTDMAVEAYLVQLIGETSARVQQKTTIFKIFFRGVCQVFL